MRHRALLLAILGAAILVAMLLFVESGSRRTTEEAGAEPHAAGVAAARGAERTVGDDPGALTRSQIQTGAEAAADSGAAADLGPPVHLEVRLLSEQKDGWAPPPGCAGWKVVAQSWVREGRKIVLHEAFADRHGIARFTFPGFVHVDWIACQPAAASGLAYSFHEPHSDVDGGSTVDMNLELRPGHPLSGRVVDLRDRPVAGAPVHVFNSSWTYGLNDWTPGYLECITGADGRFAFPALGEAEWVVAVAPGEWLQVDPALENFVEGRNSASIQAGDDAPPELLLRVAAASATRVLVLDGAGRPAQGVQVWAEPVALEDLHAATGGGDSRAFARRGADQWIVMSMSETHLLRAFGGIVLSGEEQRPSYAEEEPEPAEATQEPVIEEEAPTGPAWDYGGVSGVTDEQGRVALTLPAGRWNLMVDMENVVQLIEPLPSVEVTVPAGETVIRLPWEQARFAGRIVDVRGAPVDAADVLLWSEESGANLATECDADGRFVFPNAPALGQWRMQATATWASLATTWWRVDLRDAGIRDYMMPDAEPLRVTLLDSSGAPSAQENAALVLRPVRLETSAPPGKAIAGEPAPGPGDDPPRSQGTSGDWTGLTPGAWEVELWATVWDGTWNDWGQASYESRRLAGWSVHTRAEPWLLTWDPVPANPTAQDLVTISGVVEDSRTGALLEQAIVIGRTADRLLVYGITDETGRYQLLVRPGPLEIWAHAAGRMPASVVDATYGAGEHRRDFRLASEGGSISLVLLDRDGRRLQNFEVRFFDGVGKPQLLNAGDGFRSFGNLSDAVWCAGQPISLEDVPPGMLHLEARFGGDLTASASVNVGSGPNGMVSVRLDKTLPEILKAAAEGGSIRQRNGVELTLQFDAFGFGER